MSTSDVMPTILCCLCAVEIQQNTANMCVTCLRNNVDVTEGILKQLTIYSCRGCARFLCPPWQNVQLESKELMAACLRKVPGLTKVKLIDAVWIWTEPHSMRLKIKVTIQKEVMNGAVLQQAAIIEFTVRNQQCPKCQASYATGAWHAVLQCRQRVSHKRTFFFLEQLLLKHNAHADCINIVTFRDGMDFYFMQKQGAVKFIDFLNGNVPTKVKYSRKLVSADHCSNTGNFKHNFIVELAPLCKDDLLVLPKDLAHNLSNISRLVLVKAVGAGVHVVDPLTGERNEINTEKYWRYSFSAAMNSRELTRYVVLSVEPLLHTLRPSAKRRGADRKIRLAECVVAREADLGSDDTQFTCVTHLGHLLREGDVVMGYDLTSASWSNEREADDVLKADLPDCVLVRKFYGNNKGGRKWALRQLDVDEAQDASGKDQMATEQDYEEFLEELAADKEMRSKINLYKQQQQGSKKAASLAAAASSSSSAAHDAMAQDNDDNECDGDKELDDEEVRMDELLDDLHISMGDDNDARILTAQEASAVTAIDIPTTGFDPANFNPKDFKFV